jgi:glycosyltransferase involved in cell wall biosynthesis
MIGQRGVPASFGGVEHHVEEIGSRLVERGHDVTVFVRTNYARERRDRHRGLTLRHLPTVSTKHLDAIVHSSLSTLVAMAGRFDVMHFHALGPGMPAAIPRLLSRARVVQTIHGLDSERAKWNKAARRVLKTAEWLSARVPDAVIVVSRDLADHYRIRYGRRTWYVPNGVNQPTVRPAGLITERFGLRAGRYFLFLGRMVPEKAPDVLVRAFRRVDADVQLVMAGGSSFTDEFERSLRALGRSDPRILFSGYVYGRLLEELYSNAAAFVLPSSLEGLPLTLLEAASYGTPVIASDIPPHLEVLESDGPGRRLVPVGSEGALADAMVRVVEDPEGERRGAEELGRRVLKRYRWEEAAAATERVYRSVLR